MSDMTWVPVTERLPPSDAIVILTAYEPDLGSFTTLGYHTAGVWHVGPSLVEAWAGFWVTHWMPFPDPA